MKAVLLPALALALLAGCMQPSQPVAADASRTIAPGYLLLVRFNTSADSPPLGGVIRACPQAASGLCVHEVQRFLHPLEAVDGGWRYTDSGGNVITLGADGTGRMTFSTDAGVLVHWTTEAWDD